MATAEPFILLDDARPTTDGGAGAGARLFEAPVAVFRALRPEEVEVTIAAAEAAQAERGGTLAGYLAYEAGLALEPNARPRDPGIWFKSPPKKPISLGKGFAL